MTDFRTTLKQARLTYNIKQKEFSERLGISVKHLNRIENCHAYPSFPLLYEMCEVLGYELQLTFNLTK